MARGKKKATVAQAPPSTPPQAKKRRTSTSVIETSPGDVIYMGTASMGNGTSTRSSPRNAKTYFLFCSLTRRNGKKRPTKKLNEWDQERCEEWFDGYASMFLTCCVDIQVNRIQIPLTRVGFNGSVKTWTLTSLAYYHYDVVDNRLCHS